jgi:hypothetical protein
MTAQYRTVEPVAAGACRRCPLLRTLLLPRLQISLCLGEPALAHNLLLGHRLLLLELAAARTVQPRHVRVEPSRGHVRKYNSCY